MPEQAVLMTCFYHPKQSDLAYETFRPSLIERELMLGVLATTCQSRIVQQQLFFVMVSMSHDTHCRQGRSLLWER